MLSQTINQLENTTRMTIQITNAKLFVPPWLSIASRPASGISPIFRRRTNSIMHKQDYIEMREGVGQTMLHS
jgi:hypothetical protein